MDTEVQQGLVWVSGSFMSLHSFLWGIASLPVHCVAVVILLRLRLKLHPILQHALSSVLVHLATIAVASFSLPGIPYWHGAVLYWLGVWAYLYLFSAIYTSITLNIISYIYNHAGSADSQSLLGSCVMPPFTSRVDMMTAGGFTDVKDGRYTVPAKGRRAAQRIIAIRRFFGVNASGLYTE